MRFRAFLSYSHADAAWAGWLLRRLETYRVPSRLVGTQVRAMHFLGQTTEVAPHRQRFDTAGYVPLQPFPAVTQVAAE